MSDVEADDLPEEPTLRQIASVLNDSGQFASIYDSSWNLAFRSKAQTDYRRFRPLRSLGQHVLGDVVTPQSDYAGTYRKFLLGLGGFVLAGTPGGVEELKRRVHPDVKALVDEMVPNTAPAFTGDISVPGLPELGRYIIHSTFTYLRLRDETGRFIGALQTYKPTGSAFMMSAMTSTLNPIAVERLGASLRAARKPAAILCADLDGSAPLSRRLSTSTYFTLIKTLISEFDRCVVAYGGLVGRHAGDGVTAFFLVDTLGSESSAARACIESARMIRDGVRNVAQELDLKPDELVMRFGLHWGANLYVGAVFTEGRFEVTALGDQVNEAARIEGCASGGHALASKELLERLTVADASQLELDLGRVLYTVLGELSTATEKARRDAPAIAVCHV